VPLGQPPGGTETRWPVAGDRPARQDWHDSRSAFAVATALPAVDARSASASGGALGACLSRCRSTVLRMMSILWSCDRCMGN